MIVSAEQFVELRLSEKQEEYLRAANDSADLAVWLEIVERYPAMKVWVVRNKTVPLEVLRKLAQDPDSTVRAAVATKNKLPIDIMKLLSEDTDSVVRQCVVYNKNASPEILRSLTRDPVTLISDAAHLQLSKREG